MYMYAMCICFSTNVDEFVCLYVYMFLSVYSILTQRLTLDIVSTFKDGKDIHSIPVVADIISVISHLTLGMLFFVFTS